MAGIGFRLRKMMGAQTFSGAIRAYGYAAVISSGPLILSITTLALLGIAFNFLGYADRLALFFSSVTYVYSFCMVLVGPVQLVMVRVVADADFEGRRDQVWALLVRCLAVVSPMLGLLGAIFFLTAVQASLVFQLSSAFLAVLVGFMWMLSGYMTAMKSYNLVLLCFVVGYGASFGLASAGAWLLGPDWAMAGFACGHLLLVSLMLAIARRELGRPLRRAPYDEVRRAFVKYAPLALAGLAYNIGIWADKFLFWWFGDGHIQVNGLLYAMPLNDQAVYLGFLSIVPGMAIFLLHLEVDFAGHYATYYEQVVERATLAELERTRKLMLEALFREVWHLVKVQGAITLLLVLFAEPLGAKLGLGALQTGVLQVILAGSFLLVLFLSFLTVLFYLNRLAEAMWCCVVFAVVNVTVTSLTLLHGEQFYGLGFVAAAAAALCMATPLVTKNLRELEFETFAKPPMFQ